METEESEDLKSLSKEELEDQVKKLRRHVKQLRTVIANRDRKEGSKSEKRLKSTGREFDSSRHPKRHVVLKIAYLGWNYKGLACQEDTNETIEDHLFHALLTTKLIDARSVSNYNRCGRTDKGVSAFSQAISIDVRCKATDGVGVVCTPRNNSEDIGKVNLDNDLSRELDYGKILNRVLPKDIRVWAWAPVSAQFSARFDCTRRTYRYFLPKGDLNIESILSAGQKLRGEHDFRNFCKTDTSCEKTTVRRIYDVRLHNVTADGLKSMLCLEVEGQSFLWHQIRCIVALLILVGKGYEKVEIVDRLLDVNKQSQKPQYSMAADYPLVLFDVEFNQKLPWVYSEENIIHVVSDLQSLWVEHSVRSNLIRSMLQVLEDRVSDSSSINNHLDSLTMGSKSKSYKHLLERPLCGRAS